MPRSSRTTQALGCFQTNMRIVAGGIGRSEQDQLALWSQQRLVLPDQFDRALMNEMGVDRKDRRIAAVARNR